MPKGAHFCTNHVAVSQKWGPILGVPITRTIVCFGVFLGPLFLEMPKHRDSESRPGELTGLLGTLRAYWGPLRDYEALLGLITVPPWGTLEQTSMDSQLAGNNRPLYPKVDHYWFKVAHNYEPLALQVSIITVIPSP